MLNLLKALRQDENGVILSTEIVIIGSLLVIGMITGLTCLQKSVNGELQDVANAIGSLDQTYSFSGHRKSGFGGQCCAYTAGSAFNNCERNDVGNGDIAGCHGIGVPLHAGNCGGCGHCDSCTASEAHGTCSSCDGVAGGCSACRSGSSHSFDGPRCLDTGVPKMKVTEWPSSNDDCPPVNGVRFHESEIIFDHAIPSAEPQPMPFPESQPMPFPELQPLPEAPVPAEPAVLGFGGGFNIPAHVW